jgi:hypothetical protein
MTKEELEYIIIKYFNTESVDFKVELTFEGIKRFAEYISKCQQEKDYETLNRIDAAEIVKDSILEDEIEQTIRNEKEFMNFQSKAQLIRYVAHHFANWKNENMK